MVPGCTTEAVDCGAGTASGAQIGLAYGPGVAEFFDGFSAAVDYVEVPFEQLRHSPGLIAELQEIAPVYLHCASLSLAGFVEPAFETVSAVAAMASALHTPWIGEHLAFISAAALDDAASKPAHTLSYTICPQLSMEVVERVAANITALQPQLPAPLILENPPQYFTVPGSTMSMSEFVAAVLERSEADLLLDLTHFLITSLNMGADPIQDLERLPLERVVEVHISGLGRQSGVYWDDHSVLAPPDIFDLLERTLKRARPKALTFEYNWAPRLPLQLVLAQMNNARELLAAA